MHNIPDWRPGAGSPIARGVFSVRRIPGRTRELFTIDDCVYATDCLRRVFEVPSRVFHRSLFNRLKRVNTGFVSEESFPAFVEVDPCGFVEFETGGK